MRTTTSTWGTASGQSWLDQMRSSPEVIFTTMLSGDTVHMQAGVPVVVSLRRNFTVLPACASSRSLGVTTTSELRHGPLGWTRGVLVLSGLPALWFPLACPPPRFLRPLAGDAPGSASAVASAEPPGGVCSPPTTCAWSLLPSADPPRKWAIPKTRPRASASTSVLRTQ